MWRTGKVVNLPGHAHECAIKTALAPVRHRHVRARQVSSMPWVLSALDAMWSVWAPPGSRRTETGPNHPRVHPRTSGGDGSNVGYLRLPRDLVWRPEVTAVPAVEHKYYIL